MNLEDEDEFDRPTFVHEQRLAALEEQLYGHVRAAVDLDAISQLEQHLSLVLGEDFKMPTELALDLSTQIIEAALRRVAADPARMISFGAPDGITEEEKQAVAFDDTCPFCVAARQARIRAKVRSDRGEEDDEDEEEYCACCEMLREQWREKHAEVLAKAGLRRGPPSGASSGSLSGVSSGSASGVSSGSASGASSSRSYVPSSRSSASAIVGAIEVAKRDRARRDKPS